MKKVLGLLLITLLLALSSCNQTSGDKKVEAETTEKEITNLPQEDDKEDSKHSPDTPKENPASNTSNEDPAPKPEEPESTDPYEAMEDKASKDVEDHIAKLESSVESVSSELNSFDLY